MAVKEERFGSRKKRNGLVPPYCERCNYSFFVAKHRIFPGHEGGKYRIGNCIGLCPNCHVEADKGLIPRWILYRIVWKRLSLNGSATVNGNG